MIKSTVLYTEEIDDLELAVEELATQAGEIMPEQYGMMEESGMQEDLEVDVLERLRRLGINVESGLKYTMEDTDFYLEMLQEFTAPYQERVGQLGSLFAEKNWHDYEIIVHALKSTSKMIGLDALSESAKALEFAAKANDAVYIETMHASFMEQYGTMVAGIDSAIQ